MKGDIAEELDPTGKSLGIGQMGAIGLLSELIVSCRGAIGSSAAVRAYPSGSAAHRRPVSVHS